MKTLTLPATIAESPLPILSVETYRRLLRSEDAIETHLERLMDRADAVLMRQECTQAQYNTWVKYLADYGDRLYKACVGYWRDPR